MTINFQLPVFDDSRVREVAEGDDEFIADLLDGFLLDLTTRLDVLLNSTVEQTGSIRSLCHTLKGACLNVGAERLADCFSQLESKPESFGNAVSELMFVVGETETQIKVVLGQ